MNKSYKQRKPPVTLICATCRKSFIVYASVADRRKTCSHRCAAIQQSQRYKGNNNPAYKGGVATYTNGQGKTYRYVIGGDKKIPEHRFVMEQFLGRILNPGEEVHHINGDTLDNRPENLYVLDKKHHSRLHFELFKKVQELEQENKRLKAKIIILTSLP